MMRAIAGLVLLVTCMCGAVIVCAPIWPWTPSGFIASLLLVAGFVALDVMRVPTAPLRPLRATVGIGMAVNFAMAVGLGMSLRANDTAAMVVNGAVVLAAGTVLFAVERRAAIAGTMLVVLALYGAIELYRLLIITPLPVDPGPSQTLAYIIAASSGAAFIAALWHARILRRFRSEPKRAS